MSSNDGGDEQQAGISNLQENFFKQQKKISALKELVLKSEVAHGKSTSSAQEKVKNIAQRLTNLKSKARSRKSLEKTQDDAAQRATAATATKNTEKLTPVLPVTLTIGGSYSTTTPNPTPLKASSQQSEANTTTPLSALSTTTPNPHNLLNVSSSHAATPGSEKILLLRQQMEENKLRMAQRASSKQHLEQLVSQLKEKFDSTQQSLEDTSELGRSMTDLSAFAYTSASRERHKSATDLSAQPFNLERERMKFLENRCRLLEKQLEKEKQAHSLSLNESVVTQDTTKRIKELENKILELEEALGEQQATTRVEQELQAEIELLKSELRSQESPSSTRIEEELQAEIERLKSKLHSQEQQSGTRVELELQAEIERLKCELHSREQHASTASKEASSAVDELSAYEADELGNENERLKSDLADKLKRITELEEINDLLETTRCELASKNTSYAEQLQEIEAQLKETEQKLTETQKQLEESEERCSSLESTLEKLANTTEAIVVEASSHASTSNIDTDAQIKAEMAKQIQELQDELQLVRDSNAELEQRLADNEKLEVSDVTIAEKIKALEATIESQREDLQTRLVSSNRYEEELMEKTIELNVLNANFKVLEEKLQATNKTKPLFTATAEENASQNPELLAEVQQLKQKLDEANKASIKLKLKCKQTEKQMEKLKKTTDLHAEVVRLEKEKEQLQQKITELEDEKGQWQLQQMGTDSEAGSDENSTQMTLEEQLKLQAETIRLLEEQKYEYTEKLEAAQSELQELEQKHRDTEEAERVSAEMCELKLEEQLAAQTKTLTQLTTDLSEKELVITELKQQLEELSEDKQAIAKKLEHYLSENMELLSKVDKLSKSSSSAESIEIVERLTQQERAEIDEFNKRSHMEHEHEHDAEKAPAHESHAHTHAVNEVTQTSVVEMNPELSESLIQLREESSELMNKIELFTTERREVLEKMEHLTTENQELLKKIEELQVEKEELETNALLADNEKSQLELKLQEMSKEKQLLASQVAESSAQQAKLSQDLTSLQQSSEVVAVLEGAEGTTLFDKCEKSLSKLNSELEAYRKANDKNAKFNASKKLAKEAKNAYTQLSELLQKVKEASSAVEMVTVVETVVAVTAPNGKALAEYEQLTAQNRELKATIEELRRELQEAREDNQHGHIEISELPAITPSSPTKPEVDNKALVEAYKKQMQEKENLLKDKENQLKEIETQLKEKERQLEDNERQLRDHEQQAQNFEVHLKDFEAQCSDLQATVDDLRLQLQEARLAESEKSEEAQRLREDVQELRKMSADFDRLINDKEMSHEKQIEQATRLRKELEGKCETYESEMEILQTLITEQKQQLIEAYKENEHAINLNLLELQQRDEELTELRAELAQLQRTSAIAGEHLSDDLQRECEKLRDALKINKNLVAEQLDELANKQETIDTLSQQITELYKSMEENANKIIEKEDEITYLQELLDANTKEMERLRKENAEQQVVVDKVLEELHSHRTNMQQVPLLEAEVQRLDVQNRELAQGNKGLEQRNKELMEKLKKYAANLKKRASQCQEYELKIAALEKGAIESQNTKEQDAELSEFVERNNQLNSNIAQLETTLQEAQTDAAEIRVAIQEKTVQLLEAMEKNSKLEKELEQAKETVERQAQDVRQLQNALAASEDWGNETQSTEDAIKIANLNAELAAKTVSLERAEQTLNEVQSELLLMQEAHRERLRSEQELRQELEKKGQLIQELTNSQPAQFNTDRALTELEQRLENVTEELKTKALKFEKSKAVIKERNNQIHRLQAEIKELQSKLAAQPEEESSIEAPITQSTTTPVQSEEQQALKHAYDALTAQYQVEKANFEQTIARLETLHDGIQAKLQEDLAYIESLEQENAKYKEKICKLEDCVGEFEERRASMERRANLLDAQMQTRAEAYERSEDALVYRLNALSEHDDIIAQRLLDSQVEKEELQERLQQLQLELTDLQSEHAQLQNDHQKLRAETIDTLEAEIATQRTQLNAITEEMKHMRASYDAKLAVKSTEIDELECELSEQLQQIHAEKRALTEDLERSRDECSAQKDEVVRLNESMNALEQAKTELDREASWLRMSQESAQQDLFELQELRMQSIQDKSELDHLRHQIETLAANHEIELQGLRTQIAELDSLRMQVGQNQTDDQVFIETENKRLTDLLAEKEAQLENYQRQNLQLQMAAAATQQQPQTQQQSQIDPFALAFGLPPTNNTPAQGSNEERLERLERELAEKSDNVQRLQRDLNALQSEFHSVSDGNAELQRQLADKQLDMENLRLQLSRTSTSSNDVIPAPLFFASDQAAPSPFDDLVPARAIDTHILEGAITAGSNSGYPTLEQPTIEDLQRNVSDLEKHAHDLEQKLLMRNQRDGELEERLRDAQEKVQQREEQLQQLQEAGRQQQLQQTQQNNDTQQQLSELQVKLNAAEQQLNEREAALRSLQIQRENELKHLEEHSQNSAVERLVELQANLEQLQQLLQERDTQLQQLQRTLAQETHLKAHEKDLESQILPEACEVDAALAAAAPTLEMFFGGSNAGEFEKLITAPNTAATGEPVIEELIVPKKAYVCHPQEEALNLMDGWGDSWGGDGQEEAHFAVTANEPSTQSHSLIPREQQLEFKIQEQQERIQELQLAQERCEQQKQELQLKSGKLMKKLKEYKQKMDELQAANANANTFRKSCSVESNTMFSDLDAAIQEELKTQIVQLEGRLEEQRKLQENQLAEKEKLLNRIDVLTAGNERMSELKERQDMDVQMYQSRIRELQNKLKNLEEWGDSEPVVESAPVSQRAEDTEYLLQEQQVLQQKNTTLEAELQDLNDERQELQAMLDDEKANVRYVEETVRNLQNQLASIENADKSKYNELTLEHQNLRELYTQLEDENARLKQEVDKLQKLKTELEESLQKASANEELELQVKELCEQNEQLQTKLQTREQQENETQMQLLEHRTRCAELVQQIEDLRQAPVSEELEEKVYTLTSEKQQLEQALTAMQSEMTAMQAIVRNSPIAPTYTETNQNLDELSAQLQEKESEIVHLKQRIEDLMREDQTEKLVLEILTKNQEIHMLKMQVRRLEEDKQELEHNLSLQITKEMQESKTAATPPANSEDDEPQALLRSQVAELQKRQQELEAEKRNMEAELEVLNNHVLSSLEQEDKLKAAILEIDAKNIEIAELRQTLETQKSSPAPAVDFVALNSQWEAHVEQKCSEIAEMWRAHLEQREKEFKTSEMKLQEEITVLRAASAALPQQQQLPQGVVSADTTATSSASDESTSVSPSSSVAASKTGTPLRHHTHRHHHHLHADSINQEDSETEADAMIERMQAALESQEMEIVTLKEQLAIRSAEYARLAAQYDPFKLQTTLSHSGVNTMTGSIESPSSVRNTSTGDSSVVPKTELDLALYMLHQRDMRCEEMTLELVSLLEERDTLQLKLSNTLRQVEDIKRQTNYVEPTQTQGAEATTSSAPYDSPVKTSVAGTTAGDTSDELSQKLWQLQTVNHSKDKIIKEDRDERIRQMKKIQEDVAKMPSEALSEIVGSDLSQTSQSPSSVLLNWLWGNKPQNPTGGAPPS